MYIYIYIIVSLYFLFIFYMCIIYFGPFSIAMWNFQYGTIMALKHGRGRGFQILRRPWTFVAWTWGSNSQSNLMIFLFSHPILSCENSGCCPPQTCDLRCSTGWLLAGGWPYWFSNQGVTKWTSICSKQDCSGKASLWGLDSDVILYKAHRRIKTLHALHVYIANINTA